MLSTSAAEHCGASAGRLLRPHRPERTKGLNIQTVACECDIVGEQRAGCGALLVSLISWGLREGPASQTDPYLMVNDVVRFRALELFWGEKLWTLAGQPFTLVQLGDASQVSELPVSSMRLSSWGGVPILIGA